MTSPNDPAAYNTFARFYDDIMGDRSDVVEIIQSLIHQHHPKAKTLLELGSGTGSILTGLAPHYEVSGIEISAEMLKISQQKLPEAELHLGTIAGYQLHQTYDIIICIFDTINHLTTFADWQKLFTSTTQHLAPHGLFIFDMNTIGRQQALTAMPTFTQTTPTGSIMDMDVYRLTDQQVQWQLTIQEPAADGAVQVYETEVVETAFPLEQVRAALTAAGFTILEAFDSEHAPPSDASDRVYYTCRLA